MSSKLLICALLLAVRAEAGFMDRVFGPKDTPQAEAATEQVLVQGSLEIRVLESGFYRMPKSGWLYPGAKLSFRNLESKPGRRFKRSVVVEFVDAASGKRLKGAKTFLSLSPGQRITRFYGGPRQLSYTAIADAPALALRLRLQKKVLAPIAIPARELELQGGRPEPMAWQKLDSVADGDTLVLKGGARVRLLGVDTPELHSEDEARTLGGEEAAAFTRRRLADGELKLEYDREENDDYGRWLAYVWLKDGAMLNEELLKAGHARVYAPADFSRKQSFMKLEAAARASKAGIWN